MRGLILVVFLITGCGRSVHKSLALRADVNDGTQRLVVMFPGFGDGVDEYFDYGLVDSARERGPYQRASFVAADVRLRHYMTNSVPMRFQADIVATWPQHKITLVGASMGGMGVVGVAREFPEQVDELVLLAPYLGKRSLISRFQQGETEPRPNDSKKTGYLIANWNFLVENPNKIPITILYGEQDRLGPAVEVLLEQAPHIRVKTMPGGHGWDVWGKLWGEYLADPKRVEWDHRIKPVTHQLKARTF